MEYFSEYFAIKNRIDHPVCQLCGHDMVTDNNIDISIYNDVGIDGLSHVAPLEQLSKLYQYCPKCGFITRNAGNYRTSDMEAYEEYDEPEKRAEILTIKDPVERALWLAAYRWRGMPVVWHHLVAFYCITEQQQKVDEDLVESTMFANQNLIDRLQKDAIGITDLLPSLILVDDLRIARQFDMANELFLLVKNSKIIHSFDGAAFVRPYEALYHSEQEAISNHEIFKLL